MVGKLKAFAVLEDYENTGGIVFSTTAVAARRQGANEYADGDFTAVSCRRAPWADRYAETGAVPVSHMVLHGWHFECAGCGVRIDSDLLWERNLEEEDIQGTQHSLAFCTRLCEARHNLERAEAKHRETRWIRRFKKIVKRRFPDAEIIENDDRFCRPHAYATTRGTGIWRVEQVIVSFRWPGQQWGPASLRIDTTTEWPRNAPSVTKRGKPHWTCASGDREAFEAYAASGAR
jgi:hypothetical protein